MEDNFYLIIESDTASGGTILVRHGVISLEAFLDLMAPIKTAKLYPAVGEAKELTTSEYNIDYGYRQVLIPEEADDLPLLIIEEDVSANFWLTEVCFCSFHWEHVAFIADVLKETLVDIEVKINTECTQFSQYNSNKSSEAIQKLRQQLFLREPNFYSEVENSEFSFARKDGIAFLFGELTDDALIRKAEFTTSTIGSDPDSYCNIAENFMQSVDSSLARNLKPRRGVRVHFEQTFVANTEFVFWSFEEVSNTIDAITAAGSDVLVEMTFANLDVGRSYSKVETQVSEALKDYEFAELLDLELAFFVRNKDDEPKLLVQLSFDHDIAEQFYNDANTIVSLIQKSFGNEQTILLLLMAYNENEDDDEETMGLDLESFGRLDNLCLESMEQYFATLVKDKLLPNCSSSDKFKAWLSEHHYCIPMIADYCDGKDINGKETIVIYIRHCPIGGLSLEHAKKEILEYIEKTLGEFPEHIKVEIVFSIFTLAELDETYRREVKKRMEELGYLSKNIHMWAESWMPGNNQSAMTLNLLENLRSISQ